VLLARFDGERVALEEMHRFPNEPVRVADGLHWDILRLFHESKVGLVRAVRAAEGPLAGIGIDSWAVDFGLLDGNGALLGNPHHYRDARTEGIMERAFREVPAAEIYAITGIQFLPINSLYQLMAMRGSPILAAAETLLMIPDLLQYWLTGVKVGERTVATTTQLYDLAAGNWARDLVRRFALPDRIFPPLVDPGTVLGEVRTDVAAELGTTAPVVATTSHDTASAVVAVPAEGSNFAYISSGTWSLVGVETTRPVVNEAAREANFTNEGGFAGTVRFLCNVMGLWLLQECRRTWEREAGTNLSYDELCRLAEAAPALGPFIDPDHPSFLPPGDMPARIRAFCLASGQEIPRDQGRVVRTILESLALKYRWVIERAEVLSGQSVDAIHVVGGGSRNELLCRLTADATGSLVLAGPAEATALGNVMVQAFARGYVRSREEIRAAVRRSSQIRVYEPDREHERWDEAYERFLCVKEANQ
jgi:rhamnulokinase